MKVIKINVAELSKDNKGMFTISYRKNKYILLSLNWDDAEEEAKILLKQFYPKDKIIIR